MTCLNRNSSSGRIFSHPGGSPGKQKRLNFVRLAVLRACNSIQPHNEKKYLFSSLGMGFAKKEPTAQLNALLTAEGLQEMMTGRSWYSIEIVLPFVATSVDRSLGTMKKSSLALMSVLYSQVVNKMLFD